MKNKLQNIIRFMSLLLVCTFLNGCTQNARSRMYGGIEEIRVEKGQKVISADWDEHGNLWYFTRTFETNEVPQKTQYVEKSNFGMLNGKIIFVESK